MINVQAHRGASGYAPENTLAAFRLAVEMNADGIECDIHRSKDGVFVVCHDETIDRTSNGSGRIADMEYADIAKYNFSCRFNPKLLNEGGETAPTLEQMLDVVKDMKIINIEIKAFAGDEAAALNEFYDILARYGIVERVIVSSFNVGILGRLKALHPDLFTAYLYNMGKTKFDDHIITEAEALQIAIDHNCNAIHPDLKGLSQEGVDNAHARGLHVNCWTTNTRASVTRAIELGCNSVITNYPDWALMAGGR